MVMIALSACATFNIGAPTPPRPLDVLSDDIAGMVLALDVPDVLQPLPEASIMSFDMDAGIAGALHVQAPLQRAEDVDAAETLPPPRRGRAYYLFAVGEEGRTALRDAQMQARGQAVPSPVASLNVLPSFCLTEAADPSELSYSVRVVLPSGERVVPLISDQNLEAMLLMTGSPSPPLCRQISSPGS